MKTSVLVVLTLASALVAAPSRAQQMFPAPLSERVVSYAIDVRLDPVGKQLQGRERLTWRNSSSDLVGELRFHLYLNAFRNSATTFMRESGGRFRTPGADDRGWIDLKSLETPDGTSLLGRAEFISPDDGNDSDRTVLRLPLPAPVRPGKTITLIATFTARLPRVVARTGFVPGDFIMAGQWFPKIGVYEPAGMRSAREGGWNCHQFHSNTEFYADFGVYDVNITTPDRFVVGATGLRVRETRNSDSTVTYAYHAEDVHDFAWAASPFFEEVTDTWRHVTIRALMQPQHLHQAARHIGAAKAALDYLDAHVGSYPYPALTIVDPAWGGFRAGGMEYPMLITAGTFSIMPEGLRWPETVTVHEVGHNYFYGMLASNEFEEAWLDEGLDQYFETRIMDDAFGARASQADLCGFHFGDFELTRAGYATMKNPRSAPIATYAWQFPRGNYGALTYDKTAVVMKTLEGLVGIATMDSIMKTYFRRWGFRHPSGRDFIAVVNEVVRTIHGNRFGNDMNWYFDQTIDGTGLCDYELTAIDVSPGPPPAKGEGDGPKEDSAAGPVFTSTITISRLGEVILPVEILVRFSDGSTAKEIWDGTARVKEFRHVRNAGAVWAGIDPERKIALDIDVTNNVKSVDPPRGVLWKYTLKVLFWVQNLFHFAAIFT